MQTIPRELQRPVFSPEQGATVSMEAREHAYVAPIVKTFTTEVQLALKPRHFRRTRDNRGPSYTYTDYLLHVHAGYVSPRTADAEALHDLETILTRRRAVDV
ncbi:MAG: hypothetical protein WDA16_00285 [Candidatus Thermoplasmatota archaeon]